MKLRALLRSLGLIAVISLVPLLSQRTVAAEESVAPQFLQRKVQLDFQNPDGSQSKRISAEVALTPQERAQGLMGRTDIDGERGMLFVFPDLAPRSFWMKNTPLPLDMLFMDQNEKVACLIEKTTPFSFDGRLCQTPGRFVLELRAGQAEKLGIRKGAQLKFVGEKPFAAF